MNICVASVLHLNENTIDAVQMRELPSNPFAVDKNISHTTRASDPLIGLELRTLRDLVKIDEFELSVLFL